MHVAILITMSTLINGLGMKLIKIKQLPAMPRFLNYSFMILNWERYNTKHWEVLCIVSLKGIFIFIKSLKVWNFQLKRRSKSIWLWQDGITTWRLHERFWRICSRIWYSSWLDCKLWRDIVFLRQLPRSNLAPYRDLKLSSTQLD